MVATTDLFLEKCHLELNAVKRDGGSATCIILSFISGSINIVSGVGKWSGSSSTIARCL